MDKSSHKHFAFNFKEILLDEIALDGLEGTVTELLWRRVEKRLSSTVTEKMKDRFWNFIVNCEAISFYQLPEARNPIEILDRFQKVDEECGYISDPSDYLDGPYEYSPIENEFGSCTNYFTRETVPRENLRIPYKSVEEKYGNTLVLVASLEERWKALVPHMPITQLSQMTVGQYCILELVGRARENGQITTGTTNLMKIVKDSKLLFYNRKYLQDLGLIRVQSLNQIIGGKTVKSLLLRLKRFYQPLMQCLPKHGKLYNVVQYLLTKPNYKDYTEEMVKKRIFSTGMCKKLRKSCTFLSFVKLYSTAVVPEETGKTNKKLFKTEISLKVESDESSQSDSETTTEPLKCEYNVHINLMRQVYEKLLEAGTKGLTRMEASELFGIEFYTARTMFRTLKSKNLVREFFEDKGKQRIARYVATVSAIKGSSSTYEEEKRKFMEYLDESKTAIRTSTITESDNEIPRKKVKLEKDANIEHDSFISDSEAIEEKVTEMSCLDGLENVEGKTLFGSKKGPTLRQLKFANGILKVIKEKLAISGYQTLSLLVAKEIGEAPMDTKGIKIFVQKLVAENQIKILKIAWPGCLQKYSVFLCAPHVQPTDPIIRAKYKEINIRALRNPNIQTKVLKPVSDTTNTRPITLFLYPRYMKLQKLHESIMKLVYFNDDETYHSNLPKGYSSIIDLMPEFTLEFAIGNLSNISLASISQMKITSDMLQCKLRNIPTDLFKLLLSSSALQSALRVNLKILAMFGLIQLIKESGSDGKIMTKYMFYANQRARIIDTQGEWPRENADMEALEKWYNFESFKDVERFWNDVYNISQNTTINLASSERCMKYPIVAPREEETVELYDNGVILGNGLGPCGYDSSFHMEIPRLWVAYFTKFVKKQQLLHKKLIIKNPRRNKPKRKLRTNLTKTSHLKKSKVFVDKNKPIKSLRRKREKGSLVKWSKEDDRIIMLGKAALTIISPVAQPGCLQLRNLVIKDIFSITDPKKTASICHKRAIHLETNSALAYEKDCVINELKRRPNITNKYEELLKIVRMQYPGNMSKLINGTRLPMMELVWIMLQLVKSKSFNQKIPCVALSFEDFHDKFKIHPASANQKYNLYKTPLEADPELASVKEGIIIAVMSSFKTAQSTKTANTIYSVFNAYPEPLMRPAIEQLRKCSAVAAKEKVINAHISRFNFQDIVHSSYKVSAHYQRRWISRLNSEFIESLMVSLDRELPQSGLKGCQEVNCLLLELNSSDVLDITTTTVPAISAPSGSIMQEDQLSVLDIMMNFKLKSGTLGWRKKANFQKFSDLFENIEYQDILNTIQKNARVSDPVENADTDDKIISHLKVKKESGSTFSELQDFTGFDTTTLIDKILSLEFSHIIKRVGYFENLVVLTEFVKPWTISIEGSLIIPTPWLSLDLDIRIDILLKWASVIMNKVFEHPGCSIEYLSDQSEFLSTRAVQDICIVLEKVQCVVIKCIKVSQPSLFSNNETTIPEELDFNPYESVKYIIIFPVKDSLTRFAYLRKKMLDDYFGPE